MQITPDQMNAQIERLIDCFGDKTFSGQRRVMIWEIVQGHEYDVIISVVDKFIRASKFSPLPQDFSDSLSDCKKNQFALGDIRPKEFAECWGCGDSGFLRIERLPNFEPWAKADSGSCACDCSRGRELLHKLKHRPKFPIDLGSQFGPAWETSYRKSPEYTESPRPLEPADLPIPF